ncbi:MAG: hypothetical protein DRN78_06425 [Thermoproteota archaeon]|nr:MAG: hypothetical protein DRN78_06425 [Candidatus Korarchaeota archaeon]
MATIRKSRCFSFNRASIELLPFSSLLFLSLKLTLISSASVLYLGIFTAAIAYILQARGLRIVEASTASVISTLEPFVALIIGLLMGGTPRPDWNPRCSDDNSYICDHLGSLKEKNSQ